MIKKLIGSTLLRAMGWQMVGKRPDAPKYVLTCVPHTSNWDFVLFLATAWAFETHINWLGKNTLFEGVLGRLLLATGGVPVDRSAPQNMVEQLAARFAEGDDVHLAIPPSGTRSYRDYWKSGFYHIATLAEVPIVLGLLDFKAKRVGFGPTLVPTGNLRADMDLIREFYFGVEGKHPEKQARIRLRAEDDLDSVATPATPGTEGSPEGLDAPASAEPVPTLGE